MRLTKALNGNRLFMNILEVGDTGSFEELSEKVNNDDLVISYNPPIEAMLERMKELKGSDLSDNEVERLRNNAPAIALSKDVHEATFGDSNR
jgi:hypothetical protein